jgi:CRP-like cAMP-binding protein
MRRGFVDDLVKNRFRSPKEIRRLLDSHESNQLRNRPLPQHLTGTHSGVFYRIKLPPRRRRQILPKLPIFPILPSSKPPPIKFRESHSISPRSAFAQTLNEFVRERASRYREWFSENWPVLLFNFGSICALTGFTRSDVLELRTLSVIGSLCGVVYNLVQTPRRLSPLLWGLTFASVNGWKIFEVVQERNGTVLLTAAEEDIYVKHFLPHGATPRQFEAISATARKVKLRKSEILVKQGDVLDYVYLVVQGSTQASVLGRHLTAVSTTPNSINTKCGDSGAWIGEMAFLENYWIKEQGCPILGSESNRDTPLTHPKGADEPVTKADTGSEVDKEASPSKGSAPKPFVPTHDATANRALYTIIAKEDCQIFRWSHADMEGLMQRSTDMRAVLTRAMASAVVGKVIGFTVSRSAGAMSWSSWLSDWKSFDGARVHVENEPGGSVVDVLDEELPSYPIAKFD